MKFYLLLLISLICLYFVYVVTILEKKISLNKNEALSGYIGLNKKN